MFEKLPQEIVDKILEYTGKIKLRNGRYMNQISKTDTRYDLLKTIPTKIYNQIFKAYFSFVPTVTVKTYYVYINFSKFSMLFYYETGEDDNIVKFISDFNIRKVNFNSAERIYKSDYYYTADNHFIYFFKKMIQK